MATIYLATLGQRPEAITVALDRLRETYAYAALAVLHTAPTGAIAEAYEALRAVCANDYPDLPTRFHEIAFPDGAPLLDIQDRRSAEAYHRSVLRVLYDYRRDGHHLHLMLAGGRKAMSIYAMLAASLLFEPPHDRVWTVLSSDELLGHAGRFHILPGLRDRVQVVDLPLRPARIAPGVDVEQLLAAPPSRAAGFLAKLSPAEAELVELIRRCPYSSNAELAALSHKTVKTIETQLSSIYAKMISYLDHGETIRNKRQALLDLIRGE